LTTLGKRDVEALLRDYDDNPVGALTVALRTLQGRAAPWEELVAHAGLSPDRRDQLLRLEIGALDELLKELNERRSL
jgi:hypothetical protein